jgi:hypothetical protein
MSDGLDLRLGNVGADGTNDAGHMVGSSQEHQSLASGIDRRKRPGVIRVAVMTARDLHRPQGLAGSVRIPRIVWLPAKTRAQLW